MRAEWRPACVPSSGPRACRTAASIRCDVTRCREELRPRARSAAVRGIPPPPLTAPLGVCASPYADRMPEKREMKMRRMPRARAMAHACCGPAPPKHASTWVVMSYPEHTRRGDEGGGVVEVCTADHATVARTLHLGQRADGAAHCLVGHLQEAVCDLVHALGRPACEATHAGAIIAVGVGVTNWHACAARPLPTVEAVDGVGEGCEGGASGSRVQRLVLARPKDGGERLHHDATCRAGRVGGGDGGGQRSGQVNSSGTHSPSSKLASVTARWPPLR
jgi:hypothetical protein